MERGHKNHYLRTLMSRKVRRWRDNKEQTQADNSTLLKARGDLESELQNDKSKQFLNTHPQVQQAEMQKMEEQLRDYKTFKDQLVISFHKERIMLIDRNVEIMARLKTKQMQIFQNQCDYSLMVNALEDQLKSEQAEKGSYIQKIKDQESLIKAAEEKWLNVQEDSRKKAELVVKLTDTLAEFLQIEDDWQLKVDALEDQLRREQAEKEVWIQKNMELSLAEALEEPGPIMEEHFQTKAQKMEEDMKLLIVKNIELQALTLMSDRDKARKKKHEKKAQVKEQKRLEKGLKEKKEQEKREKAQREKEAKKEKKKGRRSFKLSSPFTMFTPFTSSTLPPSTQGSE